MKLQFYKKGIPVKFIKKAIFLFAIFIISGTIFEIVLNLTEEVVISKMDEPTFPTIDLYYLDDIAKTQLHGHVNEMDTSYMRDAIIPLDSDRQINVVINRDDYDIDSLSYEIRSLDTQRKIASNDIPFSKSGDTITASITAENLIDVGEEYLLVLKIENESKSLFYYSRIMQTENCHETELIDYALYFHNTALSDDASELSTYIEPSRYVANDNLYNVNIKSNLSQINYGDFDGTQIGDTYVTITDISSNYITMTLTYELSRGTKRYPEYFICTEDFRVRYTTDRIYLLAYNRIMEQLLDKGSIKVSDNTVNIGIRDENVQFLSNETGTIVAFVQAGSLFEYNQNDAELKKVLALQRLITQIQDKYMTSTLLLF